MEYQEFSSSGENEINLAAKNKRIFFFLTRELNFVMDLCQICPDAALLRRERRMSIINKARSCWRSPWDTDPFVIIRAGL